MQSRSSRKIIVVVLISRHRSRRYCPLDGMPALQATPKRFQCNVSANRKACDVLCPVTHASTRSGPEDQLFALCVNRIVCLSQTRHTFATACSCLKQLLLSEKKSGDEAVPCFAPGGFGGEVLEDARLFSFNAAALRLLPGSSLTAARRN